MAKTQSDTPEEHHRDHLIEKVQEMNEQLSRSGLKEYVSYLEAPWRVFWTNMLAGVARGFGFVFGATVVVAIALYIIGKILAHIPVVGQFFGILSEFFEHSLKTYNMPRG